MATIHLDGLGHSYSGSEGDFALHPTSLTWEDGKAYALLGPSGCGKTTMLNIISGLLTPSHGRVQFDGRDVTQAPTTERNIAQVFQFPVIYTTMTVGQNLRFPLECRNVPRREATKRAHEVAELMGLQDLLDHPARSLSADEKQLVSLGRGLVREDISAVLLDEPLTVIDPQRKFELRRRLRDINRASGTTMILVTHDQAEAMSFADEIVVMKDGAVQQSGSPQSLFSRPGTEFVGYFIGSPPMNLLDLVAGKDRLTVPGTGLTLPNPDKGSPGGYRLGIRPESLSFCDPDDAMLTGRIDQIKQVGMDVITSVTVNETHKIKVKSEIVQGLATGQVAHVCASQDDLLLYKDGVLVG